nr:Chain A, P9 [synthetic construct]
LYPDLSEIKKEYNVKEKDQVEDLNLDSLWE